MRHRSIGALFGLRILLVSNIVLVTAIGALCFMYVFRSWSGPMENIPFGGIEGVNLSDPSLLTEMYGWSVLHLVDRYIHLAMVCLGR